MIDICIHIYVYIFEFSKCFIMKKCECLVCKRQAACLLSVFLKICFNLNLLGLI